MIPSILNQVTNPDAAAVALKDLVQQLGLYGVFHQIGWALIALFTMAELYRVWLGGGERDLVWLAAKVAMIGYLLSGSPAPLEVIVDGGYGYFAHLGYAIAAAVAGAQFNDLATILQSLNLAVPAGSIFQQMVAFGQVVVTLATALAIWLLFVLVFMIVLALYAFAVLGSRVFVVVSILLSPLLLPCMLWRPTTGFVARWIATTLHAFLLPVIGAIALAAALWLGLAAPLKPWAECVKAASGRAVGAYACIGTQTGAFVTATIGGLVAVFIMASADAMARSYLGAVEVTTAGLLAGRTAMKATWRSMSLAGSTVAAVAVGPEQGTAAADKRRAGPSTTPPQA